ncbi:MAG: hypothetical protein JWQ01_1144 [Massilia sp.]|nr:hypothetical protein [Massilia sp.]
MKKPLRHAGAIAALLAGAIATSVNAAGPPHPDPAAADAPVPATRYESADFTTRASVATPSPSQSWKALNQVVASYDSMALTADMAEATPAAAKVTESAGAAVLPPSPVQEPRHPTTQPVGKDPHAHHKTGTAK